MFSLLKPWVYVCLLMFTWLFYFWGFDVVLFGSFLLFVVLCCFLTLIVVFGMVLVIMSDWWGVGGQKIGV